MLNRRSFLGAGVAGATALTFSSVWSQNTPQFGPPTLPSVGFKRMKLGTMEIIALNDGATFGPGGQGFVRLNFGCPRSRLQQALEQMAAALHR